MFVFASRFWVLACLALPAAAEDRFTVRLGKTQLGGLALSQTSRGEITLNSALNNTPLGVFDGSFKGRSTPAGGSARTYVAFSQSTRKTRMVKFATTDHKVNTVEIVPPKEQTDLSDPEAVPEGVVDPAQGFAKLVSAQDCPGRIDMYDGRRVIALKPSGTEKTNAKLTCNMDYRVIAGPGHLSPLKVRKARMVLTYEISDRDQRLITVSIRSGGFGITLTRAP